MKSSSMLKSHFWVKAGRNTVDYAPPLYGIMLYGVLPA